MVTLLPDRAFNMINNNLILLIFACFIIVSCRTPRYVYSPAPPNNPYFREKGESKLAGYYSTGGDANQLTSEYNDGLDIQAGYALSDHWAATADYFKRDEKDVTNMVTQGLFDSSAIRYDRNLLSFGVGYLFPITEKKTILYSVFAGGGFGKLAFTDNGFDNNVTYSRYYKTELTKWYLQSAINFYAGKYFRTALVGKLSWVHYANPVTSYTADELEYLDLNILPGKTLLFIEPAWNLQVTFKNLEWVYLDGGFTFCSDPFGNSTNLVARNLNASIGISLDLSKMERKN